MTEWSNLHRALSRQNDFSNLVIDDYENLSVKEKQEILKSFVLSLHAEVTDIAAAVNYKEHRQQKHVVDTQKILYKTVDAYRYLLAIMNLWGFDAGQVSDALSAKDFFLHERHRMNQKKWSGQSVVLLDIDDVIADFRENFCKYVEETLEIPMDLNSDQYYNLQSLKDRGISNEETFKNFIDGHGFTTLSCIDSYFQLYKKLKDEGYWIQVITARPGDNLTGFYDTYMWLVKNGIEADGVTFTPEKFRWTAQQEFFSKTKIFAIDDSPKHASEYAKHGIPTLVPEQTYNVDVRGSKNVIYVPREKNPIDYLPEILKLL